jgi:hypothetical protein
MFLPPNALAGIPCVTITQDQAVDPQALAVQLEASVPPPALRIGMNPSKGMVNVPTWFWVDGYDGGTLSAEETVVQQHKICHVIVDRDGDGIPALGDDGRPVTHQDCHTDNTTFDVAVRLYPSLFNWDFGDQHQQSVPCAGIGDCPSGMGLPFVDMSHPSYVRHPYGWSSLVASSSGLAAYTVNLGITFAADFRVSINGQDQGGWHGLQPRTLTWTTTHQVQEAQAVLTRPGLPTN